MRNRLKFLPLLVIFLIGSACYSRFDITTYNRQTDYLDGVLVGIQIDPDGRLSLAQEAQSLWCSETESSCWTLAADKQAIYTSTGNDGKVYRYQNKTMELLFDAPQVAIFSLLPLKNGSVLAGAAPDGIIYSIDQAGHGTVFCRTETHYIWDMVLERDGNILVATGLPASVLRIDSSGKILETYELSAEHARTLTLDHHGEAWIGTASTGRIYHLNGNDIQLVHDTFASEISCLTSDKNGLWFATVAAPSIKGSTSERPDTLTPRQRLQNELNEHGTIYYLDFEFRSVQEMLEVKAAPIFAMEMTRTGPVIACGNDGYLVKINETRRATILSNQAEQSIISLATDSQGNLIAGTGVTACLLQFDQKTALKGSYESVALDAGSFCNWGRIRCNGHGINSKNVTLWTRTGNSDEPDGDWAEWQMAAADGAIASPPGRYLQWKFELLDENNVSPTIDTVTISKKTANKPPFIKHITVYPVTQGQLINTPPQGKNFRQVMSDGLRIEYILPKRGETQGLSNGRWMKLRGMRTLLWEAGDPDNDPLMYTVDIAPATQTPRWINLAEELTQPVYSFDSSVFPDGRYTIRVTVDDAPSHPIGDNRSFSLQSRVFDIDNSQPEILKLSAQLKKTSVSWVLTITGIARDEVSVISGLEYSVDAEKWYNFTCSDSMFDAPEEPFKLILEEGNEKTVPSVVFLKVRDAQENSTTSTINVE